MYNSFPQAIRACGRYSQIGGRKTSGRHEYIGSSGFTPTSIASAPVTDKSLYCNTKTAKIAGQSMDILSFNLEIDLISFLFFFSRPGQEKRDDLFANQKKNELKIRYLELSIQCSAIARVFIFQ